MEERGEIRSMRETQSAIAGYEDGESGAKGRECLWPAEAGCGSLLTSLKSKGTQFCQQPDEQGNGCCPRATRKECSPAGKTQVELLT